MAEVGLHAGPGGIQGTSYLSVLISWKATRPQQYYVLHDDTIDAVSNKTGQSVLLRAAPFRD